MNHNGDCLGEKGVYSYDNTNGNIGKWVNSFRNDANKDKIGFMSNGRNDFQNQKLVYLTRWRN